nr:hypothetical protein [uncultured Flavobacterium sp.]
MKHIITFALFLVSFISWSQNIELTILIKDNQTKAPIQDVSLLAMEIKKSGLTNKDGVFKISVKQHVTLEITHTNYQTIYLNTNLLTEKLNVIYLAPAEKMLDEIVITKQPPKDVLAEVIENSINSLTNPISLKIYVLEFYKKNDVYSSFNDGILNFHISGKGTKPKSDIIVEQNRFYGLVEPDIWGNTVGYNLNNLIENYYGFSYLDKIAQNRADKKYDYLIKTYSAHKEYYVMYVTVKDEVEEALPNFEIIYDYTKKLIIDITSSIQPDKLQFAKVDNFNITKGIVLYSDFKATYKLNGKLYHLASSKEEVGVKQTTKKDAPDKIEVKNYFVINDVNTESFNYNKKNVFSGKSLINLNTSFFYNYWDFNSGLTPTVEEEEIISILAGSN